MPSFQHHPDNLIFIRTDSGTYNDTPDNFTKDLGNDYQFEGRERFYEPNIRHFVDNTPQPLQWTEGDNYIAAIDNLLAAQAARLLPPPPTLTQAKAAAAEQLNIWRGNQRVALGLTRAEFQELVYTGKALEAQRWIIAQDTPFRMSNEAARRGVSNLEMAQWVLAQWDALQNGSDQIETAYIDLQQQVEAATTVEQIDAILQALN